MVKPLTESRYLRPFTSVNLVVGYGKATLHLQESTKQLDRGGLARILTDGIGPWVRLAAFRQDGRGHDGWGSRAIVGTYVYAKCKSTNGENRIKNVVIGGFAGSNQCQIANLSQGRRELECSCSTVHKTGRHGRR